MISIGVHRVRGSVKGIERRVRISKLPNDFSGYIRKTDVPVDGRREDIVRSKKMVRQTGRPMSSTRGGFWTPPYLTTMEGSFRRDAYMFAHASHNRRR
eukprot:scaffold4061_cov108-Cylindrotheca_fusiformis.AAC.13